MSKTLLILFCFLLFLAEVPTAVAESGSTSAPAETALNFRVPRPNFKKYRGNSRHKPHKLGPLKRWRLRRKAASKRRNRTTPSIKVGTPVRTK
ncbi:MULTISPECIES: hypothetical protein [Hymenobacter]|uniref:Uncharacterized protein n=1 Tax=Hymenobacter mucosus TaxID=1411120 RepID=A0A238WX77_9BACT|nr:MULTISPECIES: hypothetical protein [Hymenobacter]SNR51088.1 hypothetical protein SAMN06269173_103220 [Hymenobacter mucosus]